MLIRVIITSAARTAVRPPISTSRLCAGTAAENSGAKRSSTKPPRLTTPACSRAETGVGASITWISQPCTGNCADLRITVSASSSAAPCHSQPSGPPACTWAVTAVRISEIWLLPPACTSSRVASSRLTSARRLARNFL